MSRCLICTDLDRTLLPNGSQPESPEAREKFRQLVSREEVTLVYVSGRHLALIEQAIAEFELPVPDYAIADVGASIYQADIAGWRAWEQWEAQIAPDWRGLTHDGLSRLLGISPALRLQEKEKQNRHKLSYYVPLDADAQGLIAGMNARLEEAGIKANLIWSIDEAAGCGLLDVLPASANKLHAIRFLMQQNGFNCGNTIFAGDSGNDLDVLLSDIPGVLVANADAEIKKLVSGANNNAFYIASGGYLGMNGNYAAGILEGVAHFLPETAAWMGDHA